MIELLGQISLVGWLFFAVVAWAIYQTARYFWDWIANPRVPTRLQQPGRVDKGPLGPAPGADPPIYQMPRDHDGNGE